MILGDQSDRPVVTIVTTTTAAAAAMYGCGGVGTIKAQWTVGRRCIATCDGPSVRLRHTGRINQPQRVRCVLFAYQVPPGAEPPRANLLPISAPALLPVGDEQRPRLIDGREAFAERAEFDRGTTDGRRPGGAVPGRADR